MSETNVLFAEQDSDYEQVNNLLDNFSSKIILTDHNTGELCSPKFKKKVDCEFSHEFMVASGEQNKNEGTVSKIQTQLFEHGIDRNTVVINLGGGMVCDIGGFVASTYKRGMPLINVPTTLLAMVDAAHGGKNGINFKSAKNQIGTIYQPVAVIIDPSFLETLPEEEILSGFAEILKYGLIADGSLWNDLKKIESISNKLDWMELIKKSVHIKNEIVQRDPYEKGDRKLLNFGHTIGHALEAVFATTGRSVSHGRAVAHGMVIESKLAVGRNILNETEFNQLADQIHKFYGQLSLKEEDVDLIFDFAKHDKKNVNGKLNFTLVDRIGHGLTNQFIEEADLRNNLKGFIQAS